MPVSFIRLFKTLRVESLTLFLIFLLIFFRDFSSALVNGSRAGMGYPSASNVLFSSSVRINMPVEPFCIENRRHSETPTINFISHFQ